MTNKTQKGVCKQKNILFSVLLNFQSKMKFENDHK